MSALMAVSSSKTIDEVQSQFLRAKPRLELHARFSSRDIKCPDKQADFVSEVVALSWKWWVRLCERGKNPRRFVSVLATYAVRAVRNGRRLCGQLKAKDALSERAQQKHGFHVESLPLSNRTRHDELNGVSGQRHLDAFEERLHDNTRTPPDEQAAFRIDWPAWLGTQTERDRRVIDDMAMGERTLTVANKHGISPARVSQLRREYRSDWQQFCGDKGPSA